MTIFDWIYPKICVGCGQKGGYFCSSCRATIQNNGKSLRYSGVVRKALKEIKYRGSYNMVVELVEVWMNHNPSWRMGRGWVVTAVPMWGPKRRLRGFNQAEMIARSWAKMHKLPYIELLQRVRETEPMYGLKMSERRRNVEGAFALLQASEVPKKVYLIDDVITSGATTRACRQKLIEAGADWVEVIALAR